MGGNGPRQDYLGWDETFMLLTHLIAARSKDPNSQVGACIVDPHDIVLGLGYNGFPRGCSDEVLPWAREGDFLTTKYAYVVHAEANALLNASAPVHGCRLYCNYYPCNECAKLIIQHRIAEVIYEEDKYPELDLYKVSKRLFELAGVAVRRYTCANRLRIEPR